MMSSTMRLQPEGVLFKQSLSSPTSSSIHQKYSSYHSPRRQNPLFFPLTNGWSGLCFSSHRGQESKWSIGLEAKLSVTSAKCGEIVVLRFAWLHLLKFNTSFTERNHGITSRSLSQLFHSYWCNLKPVLSVLARIHFSWLRRVGVRWNSEPYVPRAHVLTGRIGQTPRRTWLNILSMLRSVVESCSPHAY